MEENTANTDGTAFLHGSQSAGNKVLDNSQNDNDGAGDESTPANEKPQHHQCQQGLEPNTHTQTHTHTHAHAHAHAHTHTHTHTHTRLTALCPGLPR